MNEVDRLREGAEYLASRGVPRDALVLVLGSGLKRFGEQVEQAEEIPFDEIPQWPTPRVAGHAGSLVHGSVEGQTVVCLTGRVHLYEGWSVAEIVRAVRCLRVHGASRFLLTNAAGGIDPSFVAGDLMVLTDHINQTGTSPLLGPEDPVLGPRFPDQSEIYSKALRDVLLANDADLKQGVYVGNLGPGYETPAEVRMLATAGAHAVGMSTVHESAALNAMGAEVAGISLISNLAAGISPTPLNHEEVLEAGRAAEGRLSELVRRFCRALATS